VLSGAKAICSAPQPEVRTEEAYSQSAAQTVTLALIVLLWLILSGTALKRRVKPLGRKGGFESLPLRHYLSYLALAVGDSYKPEYGFSPKTYRERRIPIPKKLTQELKAWKEKSDKTCGLVFPTAGCRPKLNFLDCCKAIAKRAGVDPANWWLHKFRATAATRMLQKGIDLKSVQRFLGHKDIESTMR